MGFLRLLEAVMAYGSAIFKEVGQTYEKLQQRDAAIQRERADSQKSRTPNRERPGKGPHDRTEKRAEGREKFTKEARENKKKNRRRAKGRALQSKRRASSMQKQKQEKQRTSSLAKQRQKSSLAKQRQKSSLAKQRQKNVIAKRAEKEKEKQRKKLAARTRTKSNKKLEQQAKRRQTKRAAGASQQKGQAKKVPFTRKPAKKHPKELANKAAKKQQRRNPGQQQKSRRSGPKKSRTAEQIKRDLGQIDRKLANETRGLMKALPKLPGRVVEDYRKAKKTAKAVKQQFTKLKGNAADFVSKRIKKDATAAKPKGKNAAKALEQSASKMNKPQISKPSAAQRLSKRGKKLNLASPKKHKTLNAARTVHKARLEKGIRRAPVYRPSAPQITRGNGQGRSR